MPLDEIDLKIINELERNARLPVAKIAQCVSLSRNAVRQRIDRMERDQVITGYKVTLGDETALQNNISAYMFITRKDRMRGADVTTAILRIPEVKTCHIVSGELDIVVHIKAASQERIKEIWQDLAKIPGILDISTSFSLSSIVD
ncbi:MAG: Lrp/AsnC family transcriptional regulator [Emcibacteraceae bacterium]|nr:Lrp/AsnC family transcriptional regulator [Emcibacteraceae bacterium]